MKQKSTRITAWNPLEKINIKGQERYDDPEDFFNSERNTDVIYLEDMDDFHSEDKDVEKE